MSLSSAAHLPELNVNSTYSWRVRTTSPLLSQWSDKQSFSTLIAGQVIAPELLAPAAGSENVSLTPMFQWSAMKGATGYELQLGQDSSFTTTYCSNPSIFSSAWRCNKVLKPNDVYYWRVRATGRNSIGDWSSTGVFSTIDTTTQSYDATPTTTGTPSRIMTTTAPSGWIHTSPTKRSSAAIWIGIALVSLIAVILAALLVSINKNR